MLSRLSRWVDRIRPRVVLYCCMRCLRAAAGQTTPYLGCRWEGRGPHLQPLSLDKRPQTYTWADSATGALQQGLLSAMRGSESVYLDGCLELRLERGHETRAEHKTSQHVLLSGSSFLSGSSCPSDWYRAAQTAKGKRLPAVLTVTT